MGRNVRLCPQTPQEQTACEKEVKGRAFAAPGLAGLSTGSLAPLALVELGHSSVTGADGSTLKSGSQLLCDQWPSC